MALLQERVTSIPKPATQAYFQDLLKETDLWYKEEIKEQVIPSKVLQIFDKDMIEQYQIIPIGMEPTGTEFEKRLIVVTDLHQNLKEVPLFEEYANMPVKVKFTDTENIKEGIYYHYNVRTKQVDSFAMYTEDIEENLQQEPENTEEKSVVATKIENIIKTAFNKGASDIHFKPGYHGTYVLLKIDGRLVNFSREYPFNETDKKYVTNIIRGMSQPPIDSAKKNQPSDGSFTYAVNKNRFDLRISILPTILGEKVVLRLLNATKIPLNLDELGFKPDEKMQIKKIMLMSLGLFFVVGPMNTGKSTTIHAALEPLKRLDHNIITIENPCEYRDELLTQVQLREGAESNNLDAELVFKSSLRQDCPTYYFGEIRDRNDAAMLITAALSGHRIVTTLHGIDAIHALNRLYNLGVEKSALNLINGIVAQRLLPKNCTKCRESYELEEDEILMLSKEELEDIKSGTPQKGRGCPQCNEGYSGRQVVAEIIVFDNEIRDFLLQARGIVEIQKFLREKIGFRTIWEKGLELVKSGDVKLSQLLEAIRPNI